MKLFYYQRRDRTSNFGDALNPWLWHQLLPNVFDDDETAVFVGIGTLLNNILPNRMPNAQKIIIFSTGAGYESGVPSIDSSWTIYGVRGPLSARKLELPEELAIADGGILVRRLFQPSEPKTHSFGFMPHVHHATYADTVWKSICEQNGIRYIDPRWQVEQVLTAISQTEVLLAEAMHGAIAADALRVPWIPICTSARILSFKWQDWCASMQLPYRPTYLPPLAAYPKLARGIRSAVQAADYWRHCCQQDPASLLQIRSSAHHDQIAERLITIAKTVSPVLSGDRRIEQQTEALEERLLQLKADIASGKFSV